MEKLVLIDGHSILNRAFYGMPDLISSAGLHTGAVYGFLKILFKILDEEKPQYLTVAFDVHAPTFRHEAFADYKGTRHVMPEELREQVPLVKKVLAAMGIATCEQAGLEADDILGTLAKKAQAEGMEVSLVSGDRDLLQIADEHIQIRIPKTKKGQTVIENYYAKDVEEALQVTPLEFIQVKALQGDTSDNIPGVPKVGPKTATELIVRYHSVDGVYAHLDEITKKGLHDTLEQNEDKARLSLFLAAIRTDAEVSLDKDRARIGDFYTPEAFRLYTELGFKNLLPRFSMDSVAAAERESRGEEGGESPKREIRILMQKKEAAALFEELGRTPSWIGIFPVCDRSEDGDILRGVGLSAGESLWFLQVSTEESGEEVALEEAAAGGEFPAEPEGQLSFDFALPETPVWEPQKQELTREEKKEKPESTGLDRKTVVQGLSLLRRAAREGKTELAVFDLKSLFPFFGVSEEEFRDGIHLEGILDVLLGAYLCNPLKNDYEPEDVASEYLGETIPGKKQFLGKGTFEEKLSGEEKQDVAAFACRTAETLAAGADRIRNRLREEEMWELYEKMELPLTYILYDMQRIGIRVLPEKLSAYGEQLVGRIGELEASIHKEAGHSFNIASPKQLGQVLFGEMGLPGGKKTKSGYSTAADVLEKLAPDYPIVEEILEYRALTKLKSTYADGLQAFIGRDLRIHTTFHQTITATGRISSTDPNLQNIPMRTELGRAIRKVFLPREGYCFTDADYSQIELRILASMSGDEALIEAYRENRDIHRTTAARVFHTPFEEVTDLQRRNAKAVNFGIVYGISSFGLSQNLSISRSEAKEYIDEYFRMFPGIKTFLDQEVADAKEKGYSVTMFGRRRPIPELKSSNFMQRQFGERVAMNAPIQGTGADIMKLAMIRVYEELHRRGLSSRLILQIHDELLIETAEGEEEQVEEILKEGMMGAAKLLVPLEIDCHTGTDWYEAK